MVMTDPIADFLTRIRNANQAKHEVLEESATPSATCPMWSPTTAMCPPWPAP